MRLWMFRGAAVLVMALCLASFSGCLCGVEAVKIVNGSEYALTSVKLAPHSENAATLEQAISDARNFLPVDGQGYTIALPPGQTVSAPFVCSQSYYRAVVTFFIGGEYVEFVQETPVYLGEAPKNAVLVMLIEYDSAIVVSPEITFAYE